jgi:hypothetical protein
MPRAWTLFEPQYKPYTMLFPAHCRKVRYAACCLNGLILRLKASPVSQAAARGRSHHFAPAKTLFARNHGNKARLTVNANPR